jgi:hypothetical protein
MRQGKIVNEDGDVYYYKDDQLHRDDDLPAVEFATGTKWWYQNGKEHRDNDLPAVESSDGTKFWLKNDKRHRLAGPAEIYLSGEKCYYIDDKELTPEQHANHPEVKKYRLQQILNRMVKEIA